MLAESSAYLAYGITVTTESFLYAVAAWPRLQGPLAFLDLVALRKVKGNFQATNAMMAPRSAIEAVPFDVWHLVRHKLVDLELRAAEIEHVTSLLCRACVKRGVSAEKLNWAATVDDVKCALWVEYDGLSNPMRLQAAVQLLAKFGLALPSSMPICATDVLGVTWPHRSAPDSATWISLPDSSGAGAANLSIHAVDNDPDADGQEIVDVSFAVPANAKERFARLVSNMHLQLVEVTDGFIAHAGTPRARAHGDARHVERKFKKVAFDELKPRWKLVTMAEKVW
ncbi:hypothetical protein JCM9279_002457 [Rhodotorula babjevae]